MKPKLLVIVGPTATGKTDLAIRLAKYYRGSLISCDSRQVYQGLDIGTGKLPSDLSTVEKDHGQWRIDGVEVHLYDQVPPQKQYSVYDYQRDALLSVESICEKKMLPIVVGGTGYYLKALLYGFDHLKVPTDEKSRYALESLSLEELQIKIKELSPSLWESLNNSERHNKRRLARKLDMMVMYPYRHVSGSDQTLASHFDILKIGLTSPRSVLNKRIDNRLLARIKQGMIEEAELLLKHGLSIKRMKELGLEYRYLAELLEGNLTEDEFVTQLETKIHQYAKRQQTWFKKESDIHWFDITDANFQKEVEKLVSIWYHSAENDPI